MKKEEANKLDEMRRENDNPFFVIYIEDNVTDRFIFKKVLEMAYPGSKLLDFESSVEAVIYLSSIGETLDNLPDIIVTDLNMPVYDGQVVLEFVNSTEGLKNIPVIVLTSSSSFEDKRKSVLNGAKGYFTKPMTREKMTRIKELVYSN